MTRQNPNLLLIYDISNDRIRTRVADTCLDYGLERIQYSAFLANLSRTHSEELLLKLKRILGKHSGVIQSFRICHACWSQHQMLGHSLLLTTDVADQPPRSKVVKLLSSNDNADDTAIQPDGRGEVDSND
jgi:CRISPR-associated protein Cas2